MLNFILGLSSEWRRKHKSSFSVYFQLLEGIISSPKMLSDHSSPGCGWFHSLSACSQHSQSSCPPGQRCSLRNSMRYGCLLANISSDIITAGYTKKKNPNTEHCYVTLGESPSNSIIHQKLTEEKRPPERPYIDYFSSSPICKSILLFSCWPAQMFGPDELSVIWPSGSARGRSRSGGFEAKGRANKRASGELKAVACDQIGLSHMLPSLSLCSGSPCKNAGQRTHVQPLSPTGTLNRGAIQTRFLQRPASPPVTPESRPSQWGAWPANPWVTGMLLMKSTWTGSKQEWGGGRVQLRQSLPLTEFRVFGGILFPQSLTKNTPLQLLICFLEETKVLLFQGSMTWKKPDTNIRECSSFRS